MGEHKHDFHSAQNPTWCSGCGNFAIWTSLKKAFETLRVPPHKLLIVYGVGCSGNMANTLKAYGWHSLHGRALPTGIGAKLANSGLTVVVVAGDGDGYGEGMGHFIHAIRGNVDVTYIVHNNSVYGLTTGQAAPTAAKGFKAKSTPEGLLDDAVNPLALSLAAGASFVARGYAGAAPQLAHVFVEAIKHRGFSLVDVFQPCVTFNHVNTYSFYYQRTYELASTNHLTHDFRAAFEKALERDRLPIGVLYEDSARPSYDEQLSYLKRRALVARPAEKRDVRRLYKEFR